MLGVADKHRYFRIQVIVSVGVAMAVYLATNSGLLAPGYHDSIPRRLGVEMFTVAPVLAAGVIVYFRRAALSFWPIVGTAIVIYVGVLGVLPFVAANDGPTRGDQQLIYFAFLNFVGMLVFGGFSAWLGKLLGILTVLALGVSVYTGQSDILLLTPVLALLSITNVYAQWFVAIVITASSFLADR